jgi:hypothetical protein
MNLTLPLNFGERPCDRLLLALLKHVPSSSVLWSTFLVWKDFGIARDDRREVPLDEAERRASPSVAIIEQFAHIQGPPGDFVEACIAAGFFLLTQVGPRTADLVLLDFFPANHGEARQISNSKLGGIGKGLNLASARAKGSAKEQLDFFKQTRNPLLDTHSKSDLSAALLLVHQLCNMLHRPHPVAEEWQAALTVKALDVLATTSETDREVAFKWFIANRESPEIPPRIDLVLNSFPDFVGKGHRDFAKKS